MECHVRSKSIQGGQDLLQDVIPTAFTELAYSRENCRDAPVSLSHWRYLIFLEEEEEEEDDVEDEQGRANSWDIPRHGQDAFHETSNPQPFDPPIQLGVYDEQDHRRHQDH